MRISSTLSSPDQNSPRLKGLSGNVADVRVGVEGGTVGRSLVKPVIKGTPMPTHTPTPHPWWWLTPRWLITEGFPKFNHISQPSKSWTVRCKMSRFFHQHLCFFSKNIGCDGETSYNLLIYFFLYLSDFPSRSTEEPFAWIKSNHKNPHKYTSPIYSKWRNPSFRLHDMTWHGVTWRDIT